MRKLQNTLESVGINNPSELQSFPRSKLTLAPWGEQIFLFVVDPVNGDDKNSGNSLSNALKTLQKAIDLLPSDLHSREARILLFPGAPLRARIFNKSNGTIKFTNFFSGANSNDLFQMVNDVDYTLTDTPVEFQGDDTDEYKHAINIGFNTNLSVVFEGAGNDDGGGNWNTHYYFYKGMMVFKANPNLETINEPALLFHNNITSRFATEYGAIKFDLSTLSPNVNYSNQLVFSNNSSSDFLLKGLIADGSGHSKALSSSGSWNSLINLNSNSNSLFHLTNWYRKPVGEEERHWIDITDIHTILCAQVIESCKIIIDIASYATKYTDAAEAGITKTRIQLNGPINNSNLKLSYSDFNVENNSNAIFTVEDIDTDKVTLFGAGRFKFINNLIFSADSTPTIDEDLEESNISFSLDETGDNLVAKVKYSDGTIKTATIAFDV